MTDCPKAYTTLYQWLIFFGLVVFCLAVLWDRGLLQGLFAADPSYLSMLILTLCLVATLHAGWRARRLGQELCHTLRLQAEARGSSYLFVWKDDGVQSIGGRPSAASLAHEHLSFLALKARHGELLPTQDLLLERLNHQIRAGHDSGWFVADLMLKLGLLGTVIGFIFMLGSVTELQQMDIRNLQQLLTQMSDGMKIALYTTLTGLIAGVLLGLQYQMLDRAADRLLALIIEISEVDLPRHLNDSTLVGKAA
jgi:hypothetical protein